MCQLTLMDVDPKTKIARSFIRSLIELNENGIAQHSIQENKDGFGFMTFSQAPKIVKTVYESSKYWDENEKEFFNKHKNINGIYHVRSASVSFGRTLYQIDAHPHSYKDIILVHNGTLHETNELKDDKKLQKLFPERKLKNQHNVEQKVPMIDSEKFCKILGELVGDEKLNEKHIKEVVEYFYGSFVFLIYDIKQKSKVFVVRGEDKILHEAIIYENDEKLGLVLNTGKWELFQWARMVRLSMKEMLGRDIKIKVREIPKETIHIYKLGSYDLGESVAKISQTVKRYKTVTPASSAVRGQASSPYPGHTNHSHSGTLEPWRVTLDLSKKAELQLKELLIMSEVISGKSLYLFEREDFVDLNLILMELIRAYKHDGRQNTWREVLIASNHSPLLAYENYNIKFPYLLNSKRELKSVVKKIETERRK